MTPTAHRNLPASPSGGDAWQGLRAFARTGGASTALPQSLKCCSRPRAGATVSRISGALHGHHGAGLLRSGLKARAETWASRQMARGRRSVISAPSGSSAGYSRRIIPRSPSPLVRVLFAFLKSVEPGYGSQLLQKRPAVNRPAFTSSRSVPLPIGPQTHRADSPQWRAFHGRRLRPGIPAPGRTAAIWSTQDVRRTQPEPPAARIGP